MSCPRTALAQRVFEGSEMPITAHFVLKYLCCVLVALAVAFAVPAQTQKKAPAKKSGVAATKKAAPKPAVKKPAAKKPAPKAPVRKKAPAKPAPPPPPPPPISTICVDADSGIVISESNADMQRPPASMIKLLLMLMVMEGVEAKKWTLDATVTVSARAQGMGGTQVLIAAGETWPLEHMMRAVAVASANDASMAVAESLWGTEAAYLEAANARALEIGMKSTKITGVSGLPPDKGEAFDQTTARDMSILARMCVTKPKILEWAATRTFQLRETTAAHETTNKLMSQMPDCDGLKTGFIRAAGFCITASAKRDDTRLIAVVMGHQNKYTRFNDAQALLEDGFRNFRKIRLVRANDTIDTAVPAKGCPGETLKLHTAEDLWVKMKMTDVANVKYSAVLTESITPPIAVGAPLGTLVLRVNGQKIGEVPLLPPADLAHCGWKLDPAQGARGTWVVPKKRGLFFNRRN